MKESRFSSTIFSLKFAPNMHQRYRSQMQFYQGAEPDLKNEKYSFKTGNYSGQDYYLNDLSKFYTYNQLYARFLRLNAGELIGMEVFLYDMLSTLLKLKKEPVVALDIGGLMGMSWIRLAKHFEKEVKESKIAFVVTSLDYKPNSRRRFDFLNQEENQFLADNAKLVHFPIVLPSQLRRKKIKLPNGQEMISEGNTDLIYEKHSLTPWSKIPDIEILRLGKLLSPYGMYFVRTLDTTTNYLFNIETLSREEQVENRRLAIKFAHDQLVSNFCLKEVKYIEQGELADSKMRYIVFKGPQAPPIALNSNPRLRKLLIG